MDNIEDKLDDDDFCPKSESGEHEIDWNSISLSQDVELYIDVNCRKCGRSGCLGSAKNLESEMQW
jgi:hypothetical protein